MKIPERNLYPIEEVRTMAGLKTWQVYERIARGELRKVKIGRRSFVPRDDVVDLLASLATKEEK